MLTPDLPLPSIQCTPKNVQCAAISSSTVVDTTEAPRDGMHAQYSGGQGGVDPGTRVHIYVSMIYIIISSLVQLN